MLKRRNRSDEVEHRKRRYTGWVRKQATYTARKEPIALDRLALKGARMTAWMYSVDCGKQAIRSVLAAGPLKPPLGRCVW